MSLNASVKHEQRQRNSADQVGSLGDKREHQRHYVPNDRQRVRRITHAAKLRETTLIPQNPEPRTDQGWLKASNQSTHEYVEKFGTQDRHERTAMGSILIAKLADAAVSTRSG